MRNMTESELTDIVLNAYEKTSNPRLREILTSLISHLHAFAREVRLSEPEWLKGINFLTETGKISVGNRQEVILLSDLLGLSALVNMVSANVPDGATETTVIGPFFVENAPEKQWGESIDESGLGEPMMIHGRVEDMARNPVANARVDVWQTDADGMYDTQKASDMEDNLRGWYRTNADGEFLVRTVKPTSYPIPVDGPAGELVRAANRHPWRPAHIHAMITAEGYQTLITHIFDEDDEYIDSDVVFAVKGSLTHRLKHNDSAAAAAEYGVEAPFLELTPVFNMVRPEDAHRDELTWTRANAAE